MKAGRQAVAGLGLVAHQKIKRGAWKKQEKKKEGAKGPEEERRGGGEKKPKKYGREKSKSKASGTDK